MKIIPIFIAKSETMDKYLLQILLETKTIIIPGLGALTITNEETGEIMFMSYLKYDDGLLVKHIVEKDGFSENEARNLIAKYVSEINARLAQGNEYEMFQFGKFFLKDGEIEFENWRASSTKETTSESEKEDHAIELESAVIETPTEEVIPDSNEILVEEEIPNETHETLEISEPQKSLDEILHESSEEEVEPEKEIQAVEKEVIIEEEVIAEEVKVSQENSYTPPADEVHIPADVVEVEEEIEESPADSETISVIEKQNESKTVLVKRKRKPIFWILIVLIVLLLALGSLTVLFYDQVKAYLPFMESQRTEIARKKLDAEEISDELNDSAEVFENAANSNDSILNEPVKEEVAIQEEAEQVRVEPIAAVKETPLPAKVLKPSGMNFYVIGGAFEEKENADRYVAKLIADGNQSILMGPYGNVYMVSIASFNSEAEAMDQLEKLRGISSNAWIFHKR